MKYNLFFLFAFCIIGVLKAQIRPARRTQRSADGRVPAPSTLPQLYQQELWILSNHMRRQYHIQQRQHTYRQHDGRRAFFESNDRITPVHYRRRLFCHVENICPLRGSIVRDAPP